jgi:hypothetical protein
VRRAAAGVLAALALAATLAACGGGGASTTAEDHLDRAVRLRANAICRDFDRELRAIGRGALAHPPQTTLELTTQRLVKPTIPVLEKTAARLQALQGRSDDASFTLFTNLFDPAIVLAEKRLKAGEENDFARAHGLEEQLTNLAETQQRAARGAGLVDCDIDFPTVLLDSLSE